VANTLLTIDMITREALRVAHEKLTFLGTVNRSYDDSFARTGAKIGDTLRIRQPNQYVRRTGSRVMDVQDQSETNTTVTVATQDGVDMRFNSAELALDIDDFSKRYIEPAASVLVAGIEGDALEDLTKLVYNQTGTAGTVVGASGDISAITNARAKLNQYLAPKSDRAVQFDSVTMGSVVNGLKSLFHDGTQVKEAFREGFYSRNAMADWYENEKTYAHLNGTDHTTVTVNDTVASGDEVITLAGGALTVGTVFTIADVKAVHPETKAAYAHDQQFVVTAVNGNDYSISPAIISTGAKQNVDHLPSSSDVVTAFGTASVRYRQNLMYHKDAFTFVTADLPLMDDAHKCVRRVQDGLSMRVWQGSDIRNDELLMRLDILYGYKALRPEWAVRISN
jgi:hypothetical protein